VTDNGTRDHRVLLGRDPAVAAPEVSAEDQTAHARTRVGRTLNGRWHLDSLLGVGGMASVYAATHRNGNRVAIKILHPELSGYEELKERFLEEGYAANNVAHSGVVGIYDDGTSEDGCVYLVMELLEGETLQARWQRLPFGFSPRDILSIADQILQVLEAAHGKGIVHRDIKPENIFLTRDGRIKLLDFGIARNERSRRTQRTRAGSAMGTPAFMPPEQALGHADRIDGRTDLWALGATLFWLVSGRFVRTEGTANEELLQAMTERAPALRTVAPHASKSMARLIDTALAFDKQDRFADAGAMRIAVWQACAAFDADPEPAILPLDVSVQQAAVLLAEEAPSGADSSKPTTTYRPVTRSNGPSSARASEAPARSGKRFTIALALGVTLATASAVVLVGLPDRSVSASPLGKASLSAHGAALTAGSRSLTAPEIKPAPAVAGEPPQAEEIQSPRPLGPAPRAVQSPRRPAQKSAARPSKTADLDLIPVPTAAPPPAPATDPRTPSPPRDPLGRRK
jgi:serine/threonine-protein kinase